MAKASKELFERLSSGEKIEADVFEDLFWRVVREVYEDIIRDEVREMIVKHGQADVNASELDAQ